MDYLHTGIALGIDVLCFGVFYSDYRYFKRTHSTIKNAKILDLDANLIDTVKNEKNQKIYCAIRGIVQPKGSPLKSVMAPSITGVIQVMKLNEHSVNRTFGGFWTETKKNVHTNINSVAFKLTNNKVSVEVSDCLAADIIDMDLVYDNYEPSRLTFVDNLFSFFSGMRQKGLQTTEEILRDGSFVTAIGELDASENTLRIQPSNVGPMIITTATKNTILKRYQDLKNSALGKVIISGTIAAILIGFISRKLYKKLRSEYEAKKLQNELERIRLESRSRGRIADETLRDDQKCIVCWTNPKEVITLPCAHVCLCVNCSTKINVDTKKCPFCRGTIGEIRPAFIV